MSGLRLGANGGLVRGTAGGLFTTTSLSPVNTFLTSAPATPANSKTVTWEGAGDPTVSAVTEGTAGDWSDDGGSTFYSTLNALVAGQTEDTSLNHPAGKFIYTAEVQIAGLYSIAIIGHASGTEVQQSGSRDCFVLISTNYGSTDMHVHDITIGAFTTDIAAFDFATNIVTTLNYNQIQEGANGIRLSSGGAVYLDNVTVQFVGENGWSAGATWESFEVTGVPKGIRNVSRFMAYNCEVVGCGNQNTEHNIYLHGVPFYMYRCYSHDAVSGAHCVKYDGEMLYLNECTVDALVVDYNQQAVGNPIDITAAGDLVLDKTFARAETGSSGIYSDREIITWGGRRNAGGIGFSKRVEPWWEQDQTGGSNPNDNLYSRDMPWKDGVTGKPDEMYGAQVSSYSAGTPSLTLQRDAQFGTTDGVIADITTALYWTVGWGGETRTATKGSGTLVLTLSSAFSGTPAANEPVVVYRASKGQDTILLNQKMWDSAHADFYWGAIKSGAALDLTKYTKFGLTIIRDSQLIVSVHSISDSRPVSFSTNGPRLYAADQARTLEMSAPPLAGEDSITSWDRAGDGTVSFGGVAGAFSGAQPSVNDYIVPALFGVLGSSFALVGGTTTEHGAVSGDSLSIDNNASSPYTPTVRTVEGGIDTLVATPDATLWWPTTAQTTTSATGSINDFTVTVTSITGFSDGQKIQVEYENQQSGQKGCHVTTINGAPGGSTITLTDALERTVANGAVVTAVDDQGTEPDWAMPITDMWNTRRVA